MGKSQATFRRPNASEQLVLEHFQLRLLTEPAELEQWLTAPTADATKLQKPLPDGELKIVARGQKHD